MVGWKGSWWSRSWEELDDWGGGREKRKSRGAKRVEEEEEADEDKEGIWRMKEGGENGK